MTDSVLPLRGRYPITTARILVIKARAAQACWHVCSVYGDTDGQWILLSRFDEIAYPSNLWRRDRLGLIDYWHLWRERTGWCIEPVSVTFNTRIQRFRLLNEALEVMWSDKLILTHRHGSLEPPSP